MSGLQKDTVCKKCEDIFADILAKFPDRTLALNVENFQETKLPGSLVDSISYSILGVRHDDRPDPCGPDF